AVEEAKMSGHLVVILDDVHRLDKAKQDFLLPHLESNLINLIGCTTSNPYHAINSAIRSRCYLFELHSLNEADNNIAIDRVLKDQDKGYRNKQIELTDDARTHFAISANGDLRAALNGLEVAVLSTPANEDGIIVIDLETAEECM